MADLNISIGDMVVWQRPKATGKRTYQGQVIGFIGPDWVEVRTPLKTVPVKRVLRRLITSKGD